MHPIQSYLHLNRFLLVLLIKTSIFQLCPCDACSLDAFRLSNGSNMIHTNVLQYKYAMWLQKTSTGKNSTIFIDRNVNSSVIVPRDYTPPVEETFFVLRVLSEQPELKHKCPGGAASVFLFAAAFYLHEGLDNPTSVGFLRQ